MEKKKIIKAEVEKVMDSPEAKMFRKTLNEFLKQSKEQLKEKLKMKREIKLRELTKEQWDNWIENNCNLKMDCKNCPIYNTYCDSSEDENCWINHKDIYSDKFLNQEVEIEIPDILDEKEKEYLSNVIKPFRNRVISINKYFYVFDNTCAIEIYILSSVKIFEKEIIRLPLFRNEMYKGMKKNKPYTLEELDL